MGKPHHWGVGVKWWGKGESEKRKGKERKGKERKGKKEKERKRGGKYLVSKTQERKTPQNLLVRGNKGGKCRLRKKRKEEKGRKRNGKERKRKEKKRKGGGEGGEGKKNTQIPNLTFQKYKKERAPNWMRNNQTPNKRLLPPLSPPPLLFDRKGKEEERIPQNNTHSVGEL